MRALTLFSVAVLGGCSLQFTDSKAQESGAASTGGLGGSSGTTGSSTTTGSGGTTGSTGSPGLFPDGGAPLVLASGNGMNWTALDAAPDGDGVVVAGVDDAGLSLWTVLGADGAHEAGPFYVDKLDGISGAFQVVYLRGTGGVPQIAMLDGANEVVFSEALTGTKLKSIPSPAGFLPVLMSRSSASDTSVAVAEFNPNGAPHIDQYDSEAATRGFQLPVSLGVGSNVLGLVNAQGDAGIYEILVQPQDASADSGFIVSNQEGSPLCSASQGFAPSGLVTLGSATLVLASDSQDYAGTISCQPVAPTFTRLFSELNTPQRLGAAWSLRTGMLYAYDLGMVGPPLHVDDHLRFDPFASGDPTIDAHVNQFDGFPDGGIPPFIYRVTSDGRATAWILRDDGVYRWQP